MEYTEYEIELFWSSVGVGDGNACWPWLGGKHGSGYGAIYLNGKHVAAHRLSYILTYGPIPDQVDGKRTCIMHICDRPDCVNPSHLQLGTDSANHADRNAKGRQARGITNGRSKLTEAQVREILSNPQVSNRAFGRRLGICYSTVSLIRRGINWKHLQATTP